MEMKAKDLIEKYNMHDHEENGIFLERHYEFLGPGRAPSGSTYYYLDYDVYSGFHRIDCDEYWVYNAGTSLEVWIIDEAGELSIKRLGLGEGEEPVIYFPKGVVFGARHMGKPEEEDGTFFTCITVPRFSYEGFELWDKEKVISLCPQAEAFWE